MCGRDEGVRLEVEVEGAERGGSRDATRLDSGLAVRSLAAPDLLLLVEPARLLLGDPSLDDLLEALQRDPLAARAVPPEHLAGAESADGLAVLLVLTVRAEDRAARRVAADVDQDGSVGVRPAR